MNRVEICNRALGVLGHDRTIQSIDDQSSEGRRCRLFFEPSFNKVIASHDWNFCAVERLITVKAVDGYAIIPRPEDCAKIVSIVDPETGNPLKVSIANKVIHVEGCHGSIKFRYTSDDVLEGTAFDVPPAFEEALVAELASQLSGPMLADLNKTQAFTQLAIARLSDAMAKDADETAYRGSDIGYLTARD